MAGHCNIPDVFTLLIQDIFYWLKACRNMSDYFQKHGQYYWRKHLYSRLEAAKKKEDEEAARQIPAIIQQDKDKRFWWQMSYALGKPRWGACFRVQVEQRDGTTEESLAERNCKRLFGTTSIRRDSTLPSRPHYAKNHCVEPLVITPSAKLHKKFLTECMNILQSLMRLPRRSFKSVHSVLGRQANLKESFES
jgi:hypothetical protein